MKHKQGNKKPLALNIEYWDIEECDWFNEIRKCKIFHMKPQYMANEKILKMWLMHERSECSKFEWLTRTYALTRIYESCYVIRYIVVRTHVNQMHYFWIIFQVLYSKIVCLHQFQAIASCYYFTLFTVYFWCFDNEIARQFEMSFLKMLLNI